MKSLVQINSDERNVLASILERYVNSLPNLTKETRADFLSVIAAFKHGFIKIGSDQRGTREYRLLHSLIDEVMFTGFES